MAGLDRYGVILRTRYVPRLLTSSLVGRMPIGIDSLAIVLFIRGETGSFASAGAVAAAFAAGGALFAPVQGRLIDHHGQRAVLLPIMVVHAVALALLVAAGLAGAPIPLVMLLALTAGAAIPPLSAVLRLLWPSLLDGREDLLTTAYATDAVAIELMFIVGPLITAACVAFLSPQAAIAVAIACVLIGTVVFVTTPPSRAWRPSPHAGSHGVLGALVSPGVRTIVLTVVPIGFAFGSIEVAFPAYAHDEATPAFAGALIATWSLGSAIGGVAWGAIGEDFELRGSYLVLTAVLALGMLPLALATAPWVMLLCTIPAGLGVAPVIAAGNQLISRVAPPGAMTEAFLWPTMSLVIGVAAGNAVSGTLSQHAGWRWAIGAGVLVALLGTVVANVRRATLDGAVRERPSPETA